MVADIHFDFRLFCRSERSFAKRTKTPMLRPRSTLSSCTLSSGRTSSRISRFSRKNPPCSTQSPTTRKVNLRSTISRTTSPEFTLRIRIWASLRAQTLYKTVFGMMNYLKSIKLLYRVENPEVVQQFGGNTDKSERELERMARRKFKFGVSMQCNGSPSLTKRSTRMRSFCYVPTRACRMRTWRSCRGRREAI